jgi:hypothetical protein
MYHLKTPGRGRRASFIRNLKMPDLRMLIIGHPTIHLYSPLRRPLRLAIGNTSR